VSSIALALGALFILKRRKTKYFTGYDRDPWAALLVLNLAFVQIYEFLIWLFVFPDPPVQGDDSPLVNCPKANIVFTSMVYIHGVVIWGTLIPLYCIKTTQGPKDIFRFPMLFGILYTVLGIFDMIYSTFKVAGQYTCGTDGKVFLEWNVALSESRLLPDGYDWFLFSVFPFIFYKPIYIGATLAFWLALTFILPYAFVQLGEAASVFCWLGLGLFLLFLLEPLLLAVGKKFPTVGRAFGKMFSKIEQFRDFCVRFGEPTVTPHVETNETNGKNEQIKSSGGSLGRKSSSISKRNNKMDPQLLSSLSELEMSETKIDISSLPKSDTDTKKDSDTESTESVSTHGEAE